MVGKILMLLIFLLLTGVARPITLQEVCTTKWSLDHRHVTLKMKHQVAKRDHVPWNQIQYREIDHVIPRELGGADVVDNLQIQCCRNGSHITGPAHVKDLLENELHRAVCAGTITLEQAQKAVVQ